MKITQFHHPPSWFVRVNRLENGLLEFLKPVSDSSNRLLPKAWFPLPELTARVDGEWKPVTRQLGPLTLAVNSASGNRGLKPRRAGKFRGCRFSDI